MRKQRFAQCCRFDRHGYGSPLEPPFDSDPSMPKVETVISSVFIREGGSVARNRSTANLDIVVTLLLSPTIAAFIVLSAATVFPPSARAQAAADIERTLVIRMERRGDCDQCPSYVLGYFDDGAS